MPRLVNPATLPEVRAKISATLKKRSTELSKRLKARWGQGLMPKPIIRTPEMRARSAERMRTNNPMRNPEIAAKVAASNSANTSNSEQMKRSWREGRIKPRSAYGPNSAAPNKAEQRLADLIQRLQLPFEYTGNGAFWIGPCATGTRRNPDFVNKASKRVILLHGEYWHKQAAVRQENYDYLSRGWRPLVIWEKELRVANRPVLEATLRRFSA